MGKATGSFRQVGKTRGSTKQPGMGRGGGKGGGNSGARGGSKGRLCGRPSLLSLSVPKVPESEIGIPKPEINSALHRAKAGGRIRRFGMPPRTARPEGLYPDNVLYENPRGGRASLRLSPSVRRNRRKICLAHVKRRHSKLRFVGHQHIYLLLKRDLSEPPHPRERAALRKHIVPIGKYGHVFKVARIRAHGRHGQHIGCV